MVHRVWAKGVNNVEFFERLLGAVPEGKLKEKRFVDRRYCSVDVTLKRDSGLSLPGVVKDLSVYGIRVEMKSPLKKDEIIQIQASRDKGPLAKGRYTQDTIKAKVVWARKKKSSEDFSAGLKFADTRSNLRDSWVFMLLNLLGFRVDYKQQRRGTVRFPTHIKVKYQEPQGYYSGWGTLADFSKGGMAILTNSQIPEKLSLDLEVGPYGNLPILFIRGKVVWSGYSKQEKTPMAGIEFHDIAKNQEKIVNKYILAIMDELMQK